MFYKDSDTDQPENPDQLLTNSDNQFTESIVNVSDDNDKKFLTPKANIRDQVSREILLYPNMPYEVKYDYLLHVQDKIIQKKIDFDPNPFSFESLKILISNTLCTEVYAEGMLNIANFILQRYPNEIYMLVDSGFFHFFHSVLSQMVKGNDNIILSPIISAILNFYTSFFKIDQQCLQSLLESDFFSLLENIIFLPNLTETDQTTIISDDKSNAILNNNMTRIRYQILISGLNFYGFLFPYFPPEKQNCFLSNHEYLINILQILAGIITKFEIAHKEEERKKIYGNPDPNFNSSTNQLLMSDQERMVEYEKDVIKNILQFLEILCCSNLQLFSGLFLTIYKTTIPIPNTKENLGFRVRVNQPYLYYIMECRRIEKSEKEQYLNFLVKTEINEVDEIDKTQEIQIYLSKIIFHLLKFDFNQFFMKLDDYGLTDSFRYYIINEIPLPQNSINIAILILINKSPQNYISHTTVMNTLVSFLEKPFEFKFPICWSFVNFSLRNDVSNSDLDMIVHDINILPKILDCISELDDDNSITTFLLSLKKLLSYEISKGDKESLLAYLDQIGFDFDAIDINSESPEIYGLIDSIVKLVYGDDED